VLNQQNVSVVRIAKDYGLFLADEDVKKGVWLEPGRNLDYYILRNGDLLEYRRKFRTLRVRMLDGTLKTMLVDDSQPVANLMVVICTKIGITNHDEYSLVRELIDEENENPKSGNFGTLTLKRKKEEKGERDAKMEQLRKKLKTDDEGNWVRVMIETIQNRYIYIYINYNSKLIVIIIIMKEKMLKIFYIFFCSKLDRSK